MGQGLRPDRVVEAALRGAPSMFLRAELHELYDVVPADLGALCDPARLDVWPSRLDRGRILATKHHGGTLADAVVGVVPEHTVTLPDPATLEARTLAALRAGDSSELDLLEEALAQQLTGALAPWLPMTRRRWGDGRKDAAAVEVLTALAEGRPEPFAPLARTHAHFAAHALAEAAGRAGERRRALRRALRGATEPLAAPLTHMPLSERRCRDSALFLRRGSSARSTPGVVLDPGSMPLVFPRSRGAAQIRPRRVFL